jgi:hypothetical protein
MLIIYEDVLNGLENIIHNIQDEITGFYSYCLIILFCLQGLVDSERNLPTPD